MMKNIILIFLCLIGLTLYGQSDWDTVFQLQLPVGSGVFVSQFEDKVTGTIYNSFILDQGRKKIDSPGCHKVRKYFSTSIVSESGIQITLPPNEKVLSINNDILTTVDRDYELFQVKLKNYELGSQVLGESLQELTIDHGEVGIIPLENSGHIVVNDMMYGLGFLFEIYAPDLSGLYRYVPFKEGFTHCAMGSNESVIIIASAPLDDSQTMKIGFFDPVTGLIQKEVQTGISGMRVKQMYVFENLFILYSSYEDRGRKLHAFDMDGNILWEKECTLPNFHIGLGIISNTSEEVLYANSYISEISALDASDGTILWKKDLSEFYDRQFIDSTQGLKNEGHRMVDFRYDADNAGLIVLTGQMTWDGEENHSFKYQRNQCFLIDNEGEIREKIDLAIEGRKLKVKTEGDQIKLISNEKNINYEK